MYYKVISYTATNREFKSCMACQALHLIMHPKFFSQNAQHSENFTIMHNSTMLTHWYRKVYNYSIHQIRAQARITDPSFRVKDPKLQTAKKKKKKKRGSALDGLQFNQSHHTSFPLRTKIASFNQYEHKNPIHELQ